MKIEFTTAPKESDLEMLTHHLHQGTEDFGTWRPFAFFIRNEVGEIIAGCNGSLLFGDIYTDQLWVHPDHRRHGLGRNLMQHVHTYGIENGATMATVGTMSFQSARAFYESLGYIVDFERKGYAKGSSLLFMKKDLKAGNSQKRL